ncbi:mismatch-specific DNA-glycosylase [Paenibacillus antri]|uniref:Mismatch-specific DNA-glycosylase n=1 Tax=Paenibacillus antri TaxID=2582848 RepID=A0A5R9GFN6_9BACL|nr:mismatch-specific DNA-glycosylase [Paenibacillus antri]TLS50235.1 mismatch-specific DNA-glycosylase [Paenibacillus antri]
MREEGRLQPIPDHLAPGLDVLFVGYNPSIRSSRTGHHYANPSNRFWKMIHGAGLTPRRYASHEGEAMLELGYGFTNIVPRPTRTAEEITKEEYAAGRKELLTKLKLYRPRAACFVGKGVYEQFSGRKTSGWGFQPEASEQVPGVREFVGPSSSGLVRMKLEEMIDVYAELARWRREELGRRS